jgi:hypothetical protein
MIFAAFMSFAGIGWANPSSSYGGFALTPLMQNLTAGTIVSQISSPLYDDILFSCSANSTVAGSVEWGTTYPPFSHGDTLLRFNTGNLTLTLPVDTGAIYFYIEPQHNVTLQFTVSTACGSHLLLPFNQTIYRTVGIAFWSKHVGATVKQIQIISFPPTTLAVGTIAIAAGYFSSRASSIYVSDSNVYLMTPILPVIITLSLRSHNGSQLSNLSDVLNTASLSLQLRGGIFNASYQFTQLHDNNFGDYVFGARPGGPGVYTITALSNCQTVTVGSPLAIIVGCSLEPLQHPNLKYVCYKFQDGSSSKYKKLLGSSLGHHGHTDLTPGFTIKYSALNATFFDCSCSLQQYQP